MKEELANYTEVFKAVEENRVDAGITNRNFGNKNAKNFKVKKTPIIFQPINMKFAFPKDAELTPHLAERINYHIKKLKQDEHSVYYQLLEKYFEAEIAEKTVEVFPGWLSTVLKSITALFIFFILVIIVSRLQVKRKTNEIMVKNEALQISEERYREIYNSPSDAIFIHDASTGKILDVNRAMLDMYGYDREEALQLEISDISSGKHSYTQDQAGELVNRAIIDGPQTLEWRARKKNGESFWVEVALKYYEIQDSGYVIAVVRDITERKQVEEALRFERDNLHNIFEAIEDGIY
ncbi:MAG: PAS domain S-box protein, partial [Deltaproteobacteria bacterium]|nr:PAS domain S-box protein [Deltaproteobacteria bacterium]